MFKCTKATTALGRKITISVNVSEMFANDIKENIKHNIRYYEHFWKCTAQYLSRHMQQSELIELISKCTKANLGTQNAYLGEYL